MAEEGIAVRSGLVGIEVLADDEIAILADIFGRVGNDIGA